MCKKNTQNLTQLRTTLTREWFVRFSWKLIWQIVIALLLSYCGWNLGQILGGLRCFCTLFRYNNGGIWIHTKKCLKVRQALGTCQVSSLSSVPSAYVDPWDILNNFCFHVYAQKWHMSSVKCQIDPWDMLNNFCFHVYDQKWHMWNVKCYLSGVKCQVFQVLMLILGTYFCFHVDAQKSWPTVHCL